MAMSRAIQRRLAHGSNATFVTIMVIVLVGLLYGVAERNRVRFDLSEDGANRLLPDTERKIELIERSGEIVTVTAFTAQEGKADAYFKNRALKDLLDQLEYASPSVEGRLVDFDRERLTAEALGVREYGHMVVQQGDKRVDVKSRDLFRRVGKGVDKRTEFMGEAAFSRAVAQILSDKRRKIYSLQGHGELDVEDSGPGGLTDLVDLLDQENYDLEPLNLFRDRTGDEALVVPLDAAALLIARPQTPLTAAEEDAIVAYLASGKPLMVLVDPGSPVPSILDRIEVTVGSGVAMDNLLFWPYNDRPVPRYKGHSVTAQLSEQELHVVLPHIAPLLVPEQRPDWATYETLLLTSRQGWIERGGPRDDGKAVYQSEIDGAGPANMAVAVQLQPDAAGPVNPGRRVARVIVVGDSEFTTNQLLAEGPGNSTFAVNAFRWLLWDDARLSVIGKPTSVRRLALTAEDRDMLRWLVLGLMPLITIAVGAAVWASRRGR